MRLPALTLRTGLLVTLVLAGGAGTALAQEIRFTPRPNEDTDRALAEFLEGSYALWTRDTVLAAGDTVPGNVLVLEAAARIAGAIDGSIFVVDGDLFLRPGAHITGDVRAIGGGYYSSSMATVDGNVAYRPNVLLAVLPEDGGYLIYHVEEEPEAFELHGLYGFRFPTYQRVDAVTLGLGATARAVRWAWQPSLSVDVRYRTGPEKFEGTVQQFWHPSSKWSFGFEAERRTLNNEEWIWGTLANTISYFVAGEDVRNYYQADRVAFRVARAPREGWYPAFEVNLEDASSLTAEPYFVLFGDDQDVRPNPAVDDGQTLSGLFTLDFRKQPARGRRSAIRLLFEGGDLDRSGDDSGDDSSFLLAGVRARLDQPTFAGHELQLFVEARGDLAGSLPRQRWSGFGGVGTMPTFQALEFFGPRVLFGQASYFIPLLPGLGRLGSLNLMAHANIGSAWQEGQGAKFESNLILGLRVFFAEGGIALDPRTGRAVGVFMLRGGPRGGITVP